MWLTAPNRLGLAGWQIDQTVWMIEVQCGRSVGFRIGGASLEIRGADDSALPPLVEQYVRGEELHLHFPQPADGEFGFRLAIRPVRDAAVAASAGAIVFETIVSIQTSLLDTHPTLDLVAPEGANSGSRSHSFHSAAGDFGQAGVLLGAHDSPFTSQLSSEHGFRLRLFGDFLEKGVIRRARPWIVLSRENLDAVSDPAEGLLDQLDATPLPLT